MARKVTAAKREKGTNNKVNNKELFFLLSSNRGKIQKEKKEKWKNEIPVFSKSPKKVQSHCPD
jgi:hypothetical protein